MTFDSDDRLALEDYRNAVEELRAMALEARRRIDRAEEGITSAEEFVELRRRRAKHAAEKRAATAGASGESAD